MAKKDGSFVARPKRARDEPTTSAPSKQQAVVSGGVSGGVSGSGDTPKKLVVNHVPHRILFAQNLPDNCTLDMLTQLFQQCVGYQEVRMVPGKSGIAFVEFQDLVQAGIALQSLNGFKLSETDSLNLTYANQ